jgi:release factor glutamine methyltransferase
VNVDRFLREQTDRLIGAGIPTARLDLLVLLEDVLQKDRAHLLAHPELELSADQVAKLRAQIVLRSEHVPLAYIRGKTEFYGREFIINDYVLEPRPESEAMIDVLKTLPDTGQLTIIDIGCGSGALAITAKLELPQNTVIAIDIDRNCLNLTRQNAAGLGADISVKQGDLLKPIVAKQPDHYALLCNLPYVPDSFHINQAATHEPRLAIFGGPDGLDVYRSLFKQTSSLKTKPKYVLTEALPPQHEELAEIATEHGWRQAKSEDFIQVFARGALIERVEQA